MSEVTLFRACPLSSDSEHLLLRNVPRFQGGLVFKTHRFMFHSTLGVGAIKKKKDKKNTTRQSGPGQPACPTTLTQLLPVPRPGHSGFRRNVDLFSVYNISFAKE